VTGSYLPERVLSNADLEKVLDTNDEWIYKRPESKKNIAVPDINASTLKKLQRRWRWQGSPTI
jgi:3-oxoacyl-[acyl-carrier-protein] synthase-3